MKTECYSDLKSKDVGGKSMLWVRWVRMYHPGTIYIRSTLGSAQTFKLSPPHETRTPMHESVY